MANTAVAGQPYEGTIDTTGVLKFPPSFGGVVSRFLVSLRSSSFSGSITIKARRAGSINSFLPVPYLSLYLNGAVSSGGQLSTAITDTSLIEVDSSGMEIELDCTVVSGSMSFSLVPLVG